MALNRTEGAVERHLVTEVKRFGGDALKVEIVGDKGSPDRWCTMPHGRIFMVECKYGDKGKLSLKQQLKIKRLRDLGFHVYVATTTEEVDEIIRLECQ